MRPPSKRALKQAAEAIETAFSDRQQASYTLAQMSSIADTAAGRELYDSLDPYVNLKPVGYESVYVEGCRCIVKTSRRNEVPGLGTVIPDQHAVLAANSHLRPLDFM